MTRKLATQNQNFQSEEINTNQILSKENIHEETIFSSICNSSKSQERSCDSFTQMLTNYLHNSFIKIDNCARTNEEETIPQDLPAVNNGFIDNLTSYFQGEVVASIEIFSKINNGGYSKYSNIEFDEDNNIKSYKVIVKIKQQFDNCSAVNMWLSKTIGDTAFSIDSKEKITDSVTRDLMCDTRNGEISLTFYVFPTFKTLKEQQLLYFQFLDSRKQPICRDPFYISLFWNYPKTLIKRQEDKKNSSCLEILKAASDASFASYVKKRLGSNPL